VNIDVHRAVAFLYSGQVWWGYEQSHCASLFAAQLGLIVVWTILGPGRWTVRWPLGLVVGSLFTLPLLHFPFYVGLLSGSRSSAVLLASQLVALFALGALLRRRGYALTMPTAMPMSETTGDLSRLHTNQFGVRDVLLWTTALAAICGLARAIGLPLEDWLSDEYSMWFVPASIGAAAGIALLAALWAALSEAGRSRRYGIGLLLVAAAGLLAGLSDWLPWACGRGRAWLARRSLSSIDYCLMFLDDEQGILVGIAITGAMLFATLLFVRGLGYRLTIGVKGPQSPTLP
jgi:hypothetical protein